MSDPKAQPSAQPSAQPKFSARIFVEVSYGDLIVRKEVPLPEFLRPNSYQGDATIISCLEELANLKEGS